MQNRKQPYARRKNDKVQKEVEILKPLNQIVSHEIKSNQMRVIPLEKIILNRNITTEDYSLSTVRTNYYKSKIIFLLCTFLCFCAYAIVRWP